jgi:hypothetical protein
MSDYLKSLQEQADAVGRGGALEPPPDYMDALRKQADEVGQAQFRGTVSQALAVNPDQYAGQRQVAQRMGVAPAVVQALPAEMDARDKLQQVERDTADSAPLRLKYSDADFAKLAHDDSGPLSAVAAAAKWLFSADPGNGLMYAAAGGFRSGNASLWQVGRAAAENLAPLVNPLVGAVLPENPLSRMAQGMGEFAATEEAAAKRINPPKQGIVAGGIDSGIQSVVQNASWLPLAIMGGPAGPAIALTMMSLQQGGQSYGEARDKGANPQQALAYGGMQAGLEAAFEVAPLVALIKDLKAGSGFLKTLVHQAVTEIPGELATQHLQDLNEWISLHPEKTFGDYLDERPAATAQTIIATLIGVGAHTSIGHAVAKVMDGAGDQRAQVDVSNAQTKAIADLFAKAAATKTRERDPVSFADVVQQAADEGHPETKSVYIDAKTLVETMQGNEEAAGVFNQMPQAVQDQVQEALATGGAVELPIGELVSRAAGTPLEAALLPHLRTTPEGLSQTEAKEASAQAQADLTAHADRVIAESQRGDQIRSEGEQVRQTVLDSLNAVGRNTSDVNESYARLHEAFFTAMSDRMGTTPMQLFKAFDLKVKGETQQQNEANPEVLEAARTEMVSMRKRESVLKQLLECVG